MLKTNFQNLTHQILKVCFEQFFFSKQFVSAIENVFDSRFQLTGSQQLVLASGWVALAYDSFTPRMSCAFDVSKFPFDEQWCNITIVSEPLGVYVSLYNIKLKGILFWISWKLDFLNYINEKSIKLI